MNTLVRGARGDAVLDIQARLAGLGFGIDPNEHGDFGPSTERAVREFQQRRQLIVDGRVGDDTWAELVEAGYSLGDRVLYLRFPHVRGDDVRTLQSSLNLLGFDAGREDGILGERTDRGIRDFQRNVGLPTDGIVGATTMVALRRLPPVAPRPGRASVREREALDRLSASLEGARIAVDPGHGAGDPGSVGPGGTSEAAASMHLGEALLEELTNRGAIPFLLRGGDDNPSATDRARAANDAGAEILLSLHLNSHEDPSADGAATYFYGVADWSSGAGHRLAELIQEELTSRLGLRDGRTHPLSLPLLRETRMPAVQVEPCHLTNPGEERLLAQPAFRREVARALAEAVARFLGGSSGLPLADPPASVPAPPTSSRGSADGGLPSRPVHRTT